MNAQARTPQEPKSSPETAQPRAGPKAASAARSVSPPFRLKPVFAVIVAAFLVVIPEGNLLLLLLLPFLLSFPQGICFSAVSRQKMPGAHPSVCLGGSTASAPDDRTTSASLLPRKLFPQKLACNYSHPCHTDLHSPGQRTGAAFLADADNYQPVNISLKFCWQEN